MADSLQRIIDARNANGPSTAKVIDGGTGAELINGEWKSPEPRHIVHIDGVNYDGDTYRRLDAGPTPEPAPVAPSDGVTKPARPDVAVAPKGPAPNVVPLRSTSNTSSIPGLGIAQALGEAPPDGDPYGRNFSQTPYGTFTGGDSWKNRG